MRQKQKDERERKKRISSLVNGKKELTSTNANDESINSKDEIMEDSESYYQDK